MSDRTFHAQLDVDGLEARFEVLEFEVREALSEGCRATVLAATADALAPDDLLQKDGALLLELEDGASRSFQGVVIEAAAEEMEPGILAVRLVLAPHLELCKLWTRSRGFQDASVPEVVKHVLQEDGIERFSFSLSGTYPKLPYVAQIEETDFDFVRRLLHEEGITFAVSAGDQGEEILFFDDSPHRDPIAGEETLVDRDSTQLHQDVVWEVRQRRRSTSSAATVRDYQPDQAKLHTATERGMGTAGREVYLHPGSCEEAGGKQKARVVLERLRAGAIGFDGKSNCFRLQPGRRFSLIGHRRGEVNIDHLVIEVLHHGSSTVEDGQQALVYQNQFSSVPLRQPWRPPLTAPSPVRGPQLALIAGPKGEEIHTDEHGRVKVQYRWDLDGPGDDHASAWMRVGQLPLDDSMLLPRMGFEVLVDFELGDPSRPMVTGRLYNGEWRPPYALPDQKTRSSIQSATTDGGAGANELLFEDSAGAELMHLIASRNLSVDVARDAVATVTQNQDLKVGVERTVQVGTDQTSNVHLNGQLKVVGKQEVTVNAAYTDRVGYGGGPPDEKLTVGGSRDVKVGGDDLEEVTGNLDRTDGAERIIGIMGYKHEVVGDSKAEAGTLWVEAVAKSRTSSCGGKRDEKVGAAKLVKAESLSIMAGRAVATTCLSLKSSCKGTRQEKAKVRAAIASATKLKVEAKKILITADSKLNFRVGGVTIKLSSDGSVQIKAPSIDLTGVKELGQVTHRSN